VIAIGLINAIMRSNAVVLIGKEKHCIMNETLKLTSNGKACHFEVKLGIISHAMMPKAECPGNDFFRNDGLQRSDDSWYEVELGDTET